MSASVGTVYLSVDKSSLLSGTQCKNKEHFLIFTVTGVVVLVCVCVFGGRGGRGTGAAAYRSTVHLTRHIHLNMPPNCA